MYYRIKEICEREVFLLIVEGSLPKKVSYCFTSAKAASNRQLTCQHCQLCDLPVRFELSYQYQKSWMAMSLSLCGLALMQLFLALMMQSLIMSDTSLPPCSSVWLLLPLEEDFILRLWMLWLASLWAVLLQQVTLELMGGLSVMQWLITRLLFSISPRFSDFSRLRLLLEGFLALSALRLWLWKAVRLNSARQSVDACAFLLRVPMVCTSCSLLARSSPASRSTQKGLLFFSLACSESAGLGSASWGCSVSCFSREWWALRAIFQGKA